MRNRETATGADVPLTDDKHVQYTRLMDTSHSEDEGPPLPLWRKLCFAVGGVPYQMTTTVIGFFLNIFLLEVAQLKPSYVAIVLFSGKAWDAITDPTCGFLVQHTRTRWGRFRPWILFSTPFACAAYFLLFDVPGNYKEQEAGEKPETEVSMEGKLVYYLAMFCLFEGLLSGLHVPYTSLTMAVSTKQEERDSITAYRMGLEAVGVLTAVVIQGQLVQDTRCDGDKDAGHTQTVQDKLDQEWSYRIGSFIVIGIYMLCSVTVFLGTKEKEMSGAGIEDTIGFIAGLKIVFSYGPYIKAALTFLFLSIAVGIVQGNLALYYTYSLKLGDSFSFFILILLCVSILSMPIWQQVVLRFGKKTAYAAGMIIMVPVFFVQMYIPENNIPLVVVTIVLAGFGISVALLLPWSVLPDVLDLFMLETKSRQDALFYAFYVFFNKLALGVALGLSQVALAVGGYKTGECDQPDSVGYTLRLLVTPAPVVFVLLALICLWLYPIDEPRRQKIREEVARYYEVSRSVAVDAPTSKRIEKCSVSAVSESTDF